MFDIEEPFLDEQGYAIIWVKSTPVDCLDYFHCTVYERNGTSPTEVASEVLIFQNVSGKFDWYCKLAAYNASIFNRESELLDKIPVPSQPWYALNFHALCGRY